MIQQGFSYYTPLQKLLDTQFDSSIWKKVLQLYERKKYKDSFLMLLRFTDKKLLKKYKVGKDSFRIPHGSTFVNIEVHENEIYIRADFVKLPEENKIPVYRKAAELNFGGLNLPQIKQEGDILFLEYSCDILAYQPHAVYEAISDICYFADQYDDEFIEKLGASEIHDADVVQIKDAQKEKAWDDLQSLLDYSLATIETLEKDRKDNIVWDTLSTTYKIIDASFSPQGVTMLENQRQIGSLYSRTDSLANTTYKGKRYLESLKEMSKESFTKDLYGVNIFIPHKSVATDEDISNYMKNGYPDAYNLYKSGNLEEAYLMITHILYNSLYYHMTSKGMEKTIRKTLKSYANMKINEKNLGKYFSSVAQIINLQNLERNSSGIWSILIAIIFFLLGLFFNA